jgi:transmembrane sensor
MFAIEVGEPDGASSLMPMDAKSKKLLIAEAARWYARVHAPDCSDAERSACLAWRQLSTDHDQVFLQTEQVATRVTEGLLTDPRLRAMAATALDKSLDLPVEAERTNVSCWRVAAALVVSVGLGLLATAQLTKHHADDSIASYNNTTSGQQQIALADGSIVHLDVGSRLTAKIDATGRHVELLAGRAYFEVVHDSARPFSVDAGTVRTTDLGTRFQISLAPKLVSVTLAEGAVAISARARSSDWSETLIPGEQLKISTATGVKEKLNVDTTALTSWSHGRLIFKDSPLTEVLDELNRYAATKIRIGDNRLASIPIGGDFIAGGSSEQVVDALAALLPLRVVYIGPNEIVLFHRYEIETP